MSYELKRLLPRHHKIMDLVLLGQSRKATTAEVGMTPRAVSNITGSAIFQDKLARRRSLLERQKDEAVGMETARAKQRLEEAVEDAVKTQVELLDSDNPQIRLASAKCILDRAGVGRGTGDTPHRSVVLSTEQINNLRLAIEESKRIRAPKTV